MTNAEWNTISFPGLNIELPIYSTAFTVFGLEIKWYGILIAVGVLLALVYCFKRMKNVGIDSDRATDVVFISFIGAIIGARLYYVFMCWDQYKDDLKSIFAIRDGGLAIYGGLIGALLVGFLMCRLRKVKMLPILDLTAMGFLIGQAFGRWGNFFNHECFGTNTTLPWGMTSPRIQSYISRTADELEALYGITMDPNVPVHPCFLYESLWCIIGFVLLHHYFKPRKFDGEIFFMYAGWYGLGRFFIEGLRTDSLMVGSIRISQLVASVSVIAAIVVIIAFRAKIKSNGGYTFYKDTEESKRLIAETEEKYAEEESKRKEKKAKRQAEKNELRPEDRIIDLSENQDNTNTEDENNG